MKKNCKRQVKKNSELKNGLEEKEINFMLSGKVLIIILIVGLITEV